MEIGKTTIGQFAPRDNKDAEISPFGKLYTACERDKTALVVRCSYGDGSEGWRSRARQARERRLPSALNNSTVYSEVDAIGQIRTNVANLDL